MFSATIIVMCVFFASYFTIFSYCKYFIRWNRVCERRRWPLGENVEFVGVKISLFLNRMSTAHLIDAKSKTKYAKSYGRINLFVISQICDCFLNRIAITPIKLSKSLVDKRSNF